MMDGIHLYLSAGVAVLLGALVASVFTAYFNHLSTKNENINEYLKDLGEIEKLCRNYWLFEGPMDEGASQLGNLGHELRAKLDATASFESLSKSILGERYDQFTELDVKLFMAATGGTFQTQSFLPSPEVYGEVMQIITEIRALLRQQRISLFWAR